MKEKIAQLRNKILLSIFIITICFLTDRISKIYVINYFIQNNLSDLYINPYLNLILLWNKGIAFGLLESESFFYNFLSTFQAP